MRDGVEPGWQVAPGKRPMYWDGVAWHDDVPLPEPPAWKLGLSTGGFVFLVLLAVLVVTTGVWAVHATLIST